MSKNAELRKYSKSDQDPNQVHSDAAALAAMRTKKSQHFAVGTWVVIQNQRAEVVSRPGNGFMLVRYEDQTTEILRPHALAHEDTT